MLRTQVDFSKVIREWDGFGVNYVEAAQTRDYHAAPQEYGGFSLLSEADRAGITIINNNEKETTINLFVDTIIAQLMRQFPSATEPNQG